MKLFNQSLISPLQLIAQLIAPPFITENLTGGKVSNVKTPALPPHCGTILKSLPFTLARLYSTPYPVNVCVCGGGGGMVSNDWCIRGLHYTEVLKFDVRTEQIERKALRSVDLLRPVKETEIISTKCMPQGLSCSRLSLPRSWSMLQLCF